MTRLGRKKPELPEDKETTITNAGRIIVTVQTEKRIEAINNMAMAINKLSDALTTGTHVHLNNNLFQGIDGTALSIETSDEVTETIVYKTDDNDQ